MPRCINILFVAMSMVSERVDLQAHGTALFGHIRNLAKGLRTSSLLSKHVAKLAYFTFSALGPPSGVPDMPKKCGILKVCSENNDNRKTGVRKIGWLEHSNQNSRIPHHGFQLLNTRHGSPNSRRHKNGSGDHSKSTIGHDHTVPRQKPS